MKRSLLLLAACFGGLLPLSAQLTIPSDGSDGALNITGNTVIDLTQAADGAWDSPGNGYGVYDANQWAVVFKYSSVNIGGGIVTFANHRSYAPVVWLVQGDVTINGTLNLNGRTGSSNSVEALTPPEPGPGGFRGGVAGPAGQGSGYGPGATGDTIYPGAAPSSRYGNTQMIPLIGGSGNGAGRSESGGAGGGVILIAASGTVSIGGSIWAKGNGGAAGGSSGGVRIIASEVLGGGNIDSTNSNADYGDGRIRIEANTLAESLTTKPAASHVAPANPPVIWPAANAPKVRVVSVDAANAPIDPAARLVATADVIIQNNSPVNIILETTDFPIEGVVQLAITEKFGGRAWHTATRLGGDITQATWKVTTTLPTGFVVLQPRVTQP